MVSAITDDGKSIVDCLVSCELELFSDVVIDEGGFPRPVRTQKTKDFAAFDGKADVVYRGKRTERFCQALYLEHCAHCF